MKKGLFLTIFLSLFLLALVAVIAGDTAAEEDSYVPPSSSTNPLVGNWARSYNVSNKIGNTYRQLEIYTFTPEKRYTVFFYVEGKKKPFLVRQGYYMIDPPLVTLVSAKKGDVQEYDEVWGYCKFAGDQMVCTGYHHLEIPFTRWNIRPDRLDVACCGQL